MERPWFCRECGTKNFEGWGDYCNECRAKERRHQETVKALGTKVDNMLDDNKMASSLERFKAECESFGIYDENKPIGQLMKELKQKKNETPK